MRRRWVQAQKKKKMRMSKKVVVDENENANTNKNANKEVCVECPSGLLLENRQTTASAVATTPTLRTFMVSLWFSLSSATLHSLTLNT